MKATFTILSGSQPVELQLKLPCLIGRSKQASVKVKDSLISREHCKIYEQDGQLVIRDLGSTNGTFVNDHRIDTPTLIESGDTVRIGNIVMRTQSEGESIEQVVTDVVAETVDSPSVLEGYSESELGSFINADQLKGYQESIEDGTVDEARLGAAAEPQDEQVESLEDAGPQGATGDGEPVRVDPTDRFAGLGEDSPKKVEASGDNELNAFLDNMK